jgi:hypothetical protein
VLAVVLMRIIVGSAHATVNREMVLGAIFFWVYSGGGEK